MRNVSVVIPTISEEVLTLESVPEDVPAIVVREGTLNEARNLGVERAETETVVILDDDVRFSEEFFRSVVDAIDGETVVGMTDWNYGLFAGRLMGFTKSVWRSVGGFDERLRSHMGDTDFAIRCQKHGYTIRRVPREEIHHEGPPGAPERTGKWDHAWRGVYLAAKHPTYAWRLFKGMVRPVSDEPTAHDGNIGG